MLKVIYSKFSNDRNPKYAICTNILMDEAGRKYVQKLPMSEESRAHVERMYQNEARLRNAYAKTVLCPNQILEIEGQTVFEFVCGKSLSECMDSLLEEGKTEQFYELFEQYAKLVAEVSDKVCNIDLIPDNIIVRESEWTVIDYEWISDTPVPGDFILFRGIHYYVGGPLDERKGLKGADLYAHFGMDIAKIADYKEREAAFQKSLDGTYAKLSTMKYEHNLPIFDVNRMMAMVAANKKTQTVCVTLLKTEGMEKKQEMTVNPNEAGELAFSVSIESGTKQVSFSFPYDVCYVHVRSVTEQALDYAPLNFATDGVGFEGNVVKLLRGQAVQVPLEDRAYGDLLVNFVCYCTEDAIQKAISIEEEMVQTELHALRDQMVALSKKQMVQEQMLNAMEFRRRQICQMQSTTFLYYYGKVMNKLRGNNPIAQLRPLLSPEQSGLHFCIDEVAYHTYSLYVRGWVFHELGMPVSLMVRDQKRRMLVMDVVETPREDVADVFGIDAGSVYGFQIYVPREQLRTQKVYLDMEFAGGYVTSELLAYGGKKYAKEWDKRLKHVFEYNEWAKHNMPTPKELKRQRRTKFKYNPLISVIVPLYNTPLDYLETLIGSVLNQTYSNMQLCFADGSSNDIVQNYLKERYGNDARVKYKRLTDNRGISGNTIEALSLADGEFIMLSDHDDEVMLNACYEMVKALNEDPEIDAVYTDEDKMTMDGSYYFDPHFKPDFNLDFLRSNNYICHIFLVRKSIVDSLGETFRTQYDGAQDYDFILRCCEKARKVYHVPKIVYHWRSHPLSTAGNPESKDYAYEAGRASVQASFKRLGIPATVTRTEYFGRYRSQLHVTGNPLVSVIIDASKCRDGKELETCVMSVFDTNTYSNVEVLVVGAEKNPDKDVLDGVGRSGQLKLLALRETDDVYGAYTVGANAAEGDYLVMMQSDVYASDPYWMEEMLGYCQQKDVGMCGGMIVDEQEHVISAGMVVGMQDAIGHMFTGLHKDTFSYAGWLNSTRDVSAVSDVCFMLKKADFIAMHGFEPAMEKLGVADLGLRMSMKGQRIVYDTYARFVCSKEVCTAFSTEAKALFRKRFHTYFEKGDPNYNCNLTLEDGSCRLREL